MACLIVTHGKEANHTHVNCVGESYAGPLLHCSLSLACSGTNFLGISAQISRLWADWKDLHKIMAFKSELETFDVIITGPGGLVIFPLKPKCHLMICHEKISRKLTWLCNQNGDRVEKRIPTVIMKVLLGRHETLISYISSVDVRKG